MDGGNGRGRVRPVEPDPIDGGGGAQEPVQVLRVRLPDGRVEEEELLLGGFLRRDRAGAFGSPRVVTLHRGSAGRASALHSERLSEAYETKAMILVVALILAATVYLGLDLPLPFHRPG